MPRAPLPTRPLGTTGLDLTTVGFGAWAAGGGAWAYGWGPQDDDESVDAMRRALALGVNWIDTAAVYGLGHSEEVVGRVLRDLPEAERPYVFTKGGLVWNERDRMAAPVQTLAPGSIRAESARPRSAASVSSASICISSTGPTPSARRSRRRGQRWRVWSTKARCGRQASPTSTSPCSSAARRSATSTRYSRRSHSSGGRPPRPRSPGARSMGPASSATARCSRAS